MTRRTEQLIEFALERIAFAAYGVRSTARLRGPEFDRALEQLFREMERLDAAQAGRAA